MPGHGIQESSDGGRAECDMRMWTDAYSAEKHATSFAHVGFAKSAALPLVPDENETGAGVATGALLQHLHRPRWPCAVHVPLVHACSMERGGEEEYGQASRRGQRAR